MSQVTSSSISTGPGHPLHPQGQIGSETQPIINYSGNNSQDTTVSNTTDRIFTPPESDSEGSNGIQNGNVSSQESQSQLQLLQLSQLAAAQQKIGEVDGMPINGQSKKRMADGVVKHTRNSSSVSPVRVGHSRNTSTVSVASTAGSRIGEVNQSKAYAPS